VAGRTADINMVDMMETEALVTNELSSTWIVSEHAFTGLTLYIHSQKYGGITAILGLSVGVGPSLPVGIEA